MQACAKGKFSKADKIFENKYPDNFVTRTLFAFTDSTSNGETLGLGKFTSIQQTWLKMEACQTAL